MEKTIGTIPGYCINEYLLVLIPHTELCDQVLAIKKEFAKKYDAPLTIQTKPQIALVKFCAFQMTHERIINRIATIAMGIKPFKVEVNGFGASPSHTIYVNVTSKVPLQALLKELKSAALLLTLNKENKPQFIDEPHIPICQKLKPWQFEKGWLEYSHRHFTGRFIADTMILLRRPVGEKAYQPITHFEFQNLTVNTKQGMLFR